MSLNTFVGLSVAFTPHTMVKKIGRYEPGKTLGKGAFSKVKYGVDVETVEASAIKIIDKAQLAKEQMEEQLKREIAIMKPLKHEHIIGLKEVQRNPCAPLVLCPAVRVFGKPTPLLLRVREGWVQPMQCNARLDRQGTYGSRR